MWSYELMLGHKSLNWMCQLALWRDSVVEFRFNTLLDMKKWLK